MRGIELFSIYMKETNDVSEEGVKMDIKTYINQSLANEISASEVDILEGVKDIVSDLMLKKLDTMSKSYNE